MPGDLDVAGLATAYRQLVLWFGAQLIVAFVRVVAEPAEGTAGLIWAGVVVVGVLATMVALVYYGYRTAQALGSDAAWVWGAAMLVPCISLFTLLVLSSKATRACKAHGVPVGLFGPKV